MSRTTKIVRPNGSIPKPSYEALFNRVISDTGDLLEVVFHHILYVKDVYPKASFEKTLKFNVPIWKSSHPGVCRYIEKFIKVMQKFLMCRRLMDVVLITKGSSGKTLEEFVCQLQVLPFRRTKNELVAMKINIEEVLSAISLSFPTADSSDCESTVDTFQLQIRTDPHIVPSVPLKIDLKNKSFPWSAYRMLRCSTAKRHIPIKDASNSHVTMRFFAFQRDF